MPPADEIRPKTPDPEGAWRRSWSRKKVKVSISGSKASGGEAVVPAPAAQTMDQGSPADAAAKLSNPRESACLAASGSAQGIDVPVKGWGERALIAEPINPPEPMVHVTMRERYSPKVFLGSRTTTYGGLPRDMFVAAPTYCAMIPRLSRVAPPTTRIATMVDAHPPMGTPPAMAL